ncbi:MAG: hypothetical protein B7O98_05550 [Zestosphaera tikiterensis]|uniref:Anhydromevalonate phosphate decarboxylase n=1 Tax=Zestosphaera tikiterensis TaxID=1973259 RepID=A0A2R7Y422_9CREN|nr:MAG: hypothetical protein B7O98_05550 [Zestosphaera tikiterensis]
MWYISDVVRRLEEEGKVLNLKKPLKDVYEPTKWLLESDKLGKAVRFDVEGKKPSCVGNVIARRETLYEILNVKGDFEAYEKLIASMSVKHGDSWYVEENFWEHYVRYEGSFEDLPAIKFFERDGGKYITSSVVIAEASDVKSYNASVHRLMLVPGKGFAIRIVPRHLYRIYEFNRGLGRETPIAIAIGTHPLALLSASISPPYGVFEFALASYLASSKVPIVKTPMYGLPVVAGTSVVIEGRITEEFVDEGPFVDLLSLYDVVRKQPLIKVDSIYVNKEEPLFHVILPGGSEHKILMGFSREAFIWDAVRKVVPKVVKVRLTNGGGGWLHAVVSIEKNHDGDSKNAIMAAFAAHQSLKHVVVVDSDVDPDSPEEVEWAIATRFQASKGLIVIKDARGSTLDPSSSDGLTDKVGIDATTPTKERIKYLKPKVPL